MNQDDFLKLENQLCFPLYAASRLVTKAYQPLLDELDITYPQYLILLLLWEHKELTVKDIGKKLYLQSNTLTPLLKRMESKNLVIRKRSAKDERKVFINLTKEAFGLKDKALCIPLKLSKGLGDKFTEEQYINLRNDLQKFISLITATE